MNSTVPGAGANSCSASSALSRASTAWPNSDGGSPSSRPPAATWICSLTMSRPGRRLGDRVLDLQAGVDLEEREQLLVGLVEELDGARVDVAGRLDQRLGRLAQRGVLLGAERGGARLLDQLLVAPLHRAVAHARRPHVAVLVGDDLHLDVPAALDQPLHEDDRVAEGAQRLDLGALERVGEFVLGPHDADAAAAAAAAGLDDERVADGGGVPEAVLEGLDRAAAPGGHRDAGLLGQHLRLDLGAEQAHGLGGRADEGHAERGAQLRERGVLGDEAPADPGGVGAASRVRARPSSSWSR